MKKLIESADVSEIVCDNKDCDFTFKLNKFANLPFFINVECPKCKQNLLTQEDYDRAIAFHTSVNFINKWFGWLAYVIPKKIGKKQVVQVHIHKGIHITKCDKP